MSNTYSFSSDYMNGAHPEILKKFAEVNFENQTGYGTDVYTKDAAEKIKKAFGCPDGEVFFLVGGTQTNQVIIDSVLKPYEGVISPKTGHINVHEAGAIEFTGRKVIELPAKEGKMSADNLKAFVSDFYADSNHEHMVFPGMVYLSFPTEYGTLYTKNELETIYSICREYGMTLFIDGARLGYGLEGIGNDVTPGDLSRLCDVFYVGGTKVGAFCGEAVVFTHHNAPAHFVNLIKKHGALLAKGWIVGLQFDVLFTNGLYFEIAKHAIDSAKRLKDIFKAKGYPFFMDSPTNQQFIILEKSKLKELEKKVGFGFWENIEGNRTVVRFATSWATDDDSLNYLESIL